MRQEIKKSKTDIAKQRASWNAKYLEYGDKSLDELQEMLPRLGGNYRRICAHIIEMKQLEGEVK